MHGADSRERAKQCSLAGLAKEVLEPLVEDIWLAAHFLNGANPDSLVSTREPLKMAPDLRVGLKRGKNIVGNTERLSISYLRKYDRGRRTQRNGRVRRAEMWSCRAGCSPKES
jgi:hypothetical protein